MWLLFLCEGIQGHSNPQEIHNHPATSTDLVLPPLPPLKHSSTMFTGRDSYLKHLKNHFGFNSTGKRKLFLLHGIGGIGKTQICLKFIEEHGNM
jgi:hypothetical protein